MKWLDSILCLPTIGLQLVPNFEIGADARRILAPLMNDIAAKQDKIEFSDYQGWGIECKVDDGYSFRVDPSNLIVEFAYRIAPTSQPGQLPIFELQKVTPYTELLRGCVVRIDKLFDLILSQNHEIKLLRIGIMARMTLDPADLPPGIQQLFTYLGEPWQNRLVKCDSLILADLKRIDKYTDRCHHILKFDSTDKTPQLECTLDWQRVFPQKETLTKRDRFASLLSSALDAAESYFERVGEGTYGTE